MMVLVVGKTNALSTLVSLTCDQGRCGLEARAPTLERGLLARNENIHPAQELVWTFQPYTQQLNPGGEA